MSESKKVYVQLAGKQIFCDLIEAKAPKNHPNNLRYGSTVIFPKDDVEQTERLFNAIAEVVKRTWPDEWESRLAEIEGAIENGIQPRFSPINIQDGDLHFPEYNAGNWVVSARRNEDAGRPILLTKEGEVCFEGDDLVVPISEVPKKFDGVIVAFEVWAMKSNDRVNFRLEVVRTGFPSPSLSLAPPNKELAASIASMELPKSIAGPSQAPAISASVSEPEPEKPKKRAPRKSKAKEAEVLPPESEDEPVKPKKGGRTSLFR